MLDVYNKSVLTVIAAALVAIVLQQAAPGAGASLSCGESPNRPCYVAIVSR